jgi:glycosyltransferase involved in cell wall biosynthesis
MKNIRHPIIGYTGAISGTRLDKNIIAHIAEQLPDCSLVLIGPVTDGFDLTFLKRFSNVYFLGRKEPAEIPDHIYHFDVCINPQQVNELTIGNYPRKADEYLAMGKPMVATDTEGMQLFANYVFLCRTKEEYVDNIKRILQEPHSQNGLVKKQRQDFALSHTWENSLAKLADVLYEFENKKDINGKLGQA